MNKPTCAKCGAKSGNLERTEGYVLGGMKLMILRCLLCGDQQEIRIPPPKDRPFKPNAVTVRMNNKHHAKTETCKVVGCSNKYSPVYSKRDMCAKCSKFMSNRLGYGAPAPFIRQGDVWVQNPNSKKQKGNAA